MEEGCTGSGSRRRDEFKGKHGGVTVTVLLSTHLQIDEGLMDWRSADGPNDTGGDKTGQGWEAATGVGDGTTRLR
ncbi:hypothetical protein PIB30_086630 [Stylosanthes scabra]|uniref:Uncharacterized protein n=1 Tax=Stylosanthes scabra TaxID=79078 RepID=A0ABU6YTY5_9FABA|nr:hypothetical protein [Stylosanthes scabra]